MPPLSSTRPAHLQPTTTTPLLQSTQSMDLTTDFTTQVHDNTTRKSLGRRVSFAKNAHVRLIELRTNEDNTNSTASPPASPAASSDPVEEAPPAPAPVNNENAYPGATSRNRRRSSLTRPAGFTTSGEPSALADEEFDDSMEDMDMTDDLDEVIRGRAVSLGGKARAPLAQKSVEVPSAGPSQPEDESQQSYTDQSYASEPSQDPHTEFEVPTNRGTRPPPTEDPVWVALRNMTHSGDVPYEDPPSSDDESGFQAANQGIINTEDNSFSSADDSSFNDANNNDRTMNLSQVVGRLSMAGPGPRFSLAQESTMDETGIYSSFPPPAQSTPAPPPRPQPQEPPRPSVFRPPSPAKTATPVAASGTNKPIFFPPAPPTAASASTSKRPREDGAEVENGTPAKRQTIAGRWTPTTSTPSKPASPKKTPDAGKPKPLSPSKRAPFLVPRTSTAPSPAAKPSALPKPTGTLRRPSSYFGQRKSMAPTVGGAAASGSASVVSNGPKSPRKVSGLGMGRASMGSAPSDAWKRFDRNPVSLKGKEKQVVPPSEPIVAQEVDQPKAASPQASASPRVAFPPIEAGSSRTEAGSSVVNVSNMGDATEESEVARDDMEVDATAQWREGVRAAEPPNDDEEVQTISIEQFFELTGVRFMDELDAPRRSVHQPSRKPRPSAEIGLAEYAVATSITIPELELYSKVSSDLQAWMENAKVVFAQEEEDTAKAAPLLFTEFLRGDEEDQSELLHQLELIRTNVRLKAKGEWYDFKLQWIETLRDKLDQGLVALRKDRDLLDKLRSMPDEVLPPLEREYEDLMRELEQEQAAVAEIENCDQDYLNELKGTLADQEIEVEAYKADLAEQTFRLQSLQERAAEMDDEKRQAQMAIAEANRFLHVQENSTQAELVRLRQELDVFEDLHMLRVTKLVPELFEYEYASQSRVSIPLKKFAPVPSKVKITRIETGRSPLDDFPELTRYFFEDAARHVPHGERVSVRKIVEALADYWTACSQLRAQLFQLTIKYPLYIDVLPNQGFRATAIVMFPAVKGRANISFAFAPDVHGTWPLTIGALKAEVEIMYGPLDKNEIMSAISQSLANPTQVHGCLLDACIDAQELYAPSS
ncbi:Spc7 domain-containing protein [Mycena kentingensis (nom. inval.)]|nr:Spc7 domain-containing protein [Mycena kentingensis (nom. inval.)]